MKVFSVFFAVYLTIVLLTDVSLSGFWTDVIFSILLSIYAIIISFRTRADKLRLTAILKVSNILCSLIVFGILVLHLINPFAWSTFKLRSFYFQPVEGRLFNAYFKPVGSYAGGNGDFWIAETPKYFPLVEWRVYRDRTVDHNFNDDTFEGEPIDNYKVVRNFIKDEVISR